jgi:hypothetical protein
MTRSSKILRIPQVAIRSVLYRKSWCGAAAGEYGIIVRRLNFVVIEIVGDTGGNVGQVSRFEAA